MKLYSENKEYKLYQGNMLDMLEVIEPNSIDSIVTDPPYELNFMGKGWDNSGIAFQPSTWLKCLEVLKPGGYLLAFGGSRTYHRIACAIEDAGFEIRDTIMWLYGSGFPKSLSISKTLEKREGIIEETTGTLFNNPGGKRDLSKRSDYGYVYEPQLELAKKWQGWGTALKPSFEPIIVARKPLDGSCIDNVIKWGVGGINIDECRVNFVNEEDYKITANKNQHEKFGTQPMTNNNVYGDYSMIQPKNYSSTGRFPANTILTYDDTDFEEVCGGFPETSSNGGTTTMPDLRDVGKKSKESIGIDKLSFGQVSNAERKESNYVAPMDSGSAARYFYNAKVSDKDEDVDRPIGRFPANTILTYDDGDYEEVCGGMPDTKSDIRKPSGGKILNPESGWNNNSMIDKTIRGFADEGSASRYFYCAKASKKDRDEGLAEFEEQRKAGYGYDRGYMNPGEGMFKDRTTARKNTHPTVKPTALVQYLVRLVTPNGGTVLDPFNGSGSTGKAVMYENREKLKGYKYIGIELTPEYLPISRARIEYASDPNNVIVREETDDETEEVTKVSYKEVNLF